MKYSDVFKQSIILVNSIRNCTTQIKKQNYDRGVRRFQELLYRFQQLLQSLITNEKELREEGIETDMNQVTQMLSEVLAAQEAQDYLLLSDLLELLIRPFVLELIGVIQEIAHRTGQEEALYPDMWDRNKEFLTRQNPALVQQAEKAFEKLIKKPEEFLTFQGEDGTLYRLEETRTGLLTMKIERKERTYYLHSNQDAFEQGEFFADTYADMEKDSYAVLGLGCGYHVLSLGERGFYEKDIYVYEPDLHVLALALKYVEFGASLGTWFHISYDPMLTELGKALQEESTCFVMHYPSLQNIGNPQLRNRFLQYFIQDSSYRNQENLLLYNFRKNTKALLKSGIAGEIATVEELLPAMKGKKVCIVAAGPSLDKNVQELLEKRKDLFILATGTVFRKLHALKIHVDAVIITDSNYRVVGQIAGVEQETVPLLLLSTANWHFIEKYQGRKYLIFQEGFPPAEQFAKEKGLKLFQTGGSVSTTAFDVAVQGKAASILFIGLDLAFTNKLAHAAGTSNRVAMDEENLIKIKGYYGDTVLADQKFILYREWIEERIRRLPKDAPDVINATEGGCYLTGALHMSLAEALK